MCSYASQIVFGQDQPALGPLLGEFQRGWWWLRTQKMPWKYKNRKIKSFKPSSSVICVTYKVPPRQIARSLRNEIRKMHLLKGPKWFYIEFGGESTTLRPHLKRRRKSLVALLLLLLHKQQKVDGLIKANDLSVSLLLPFVCIFLCRLPIQ